MTGTTPPAARGRRRPGPAPALAAALALTLLSAPGTAVAADGGAASGETTAGDPTTTADGVEVRTYGTVPVVPYQRSGRGEVYLAVHAVQRLERATVVYLSAGYLEPGTDANPGGLAELPGPGARFGGGGPLTSTRVVDVENGVVATTLPQGDGDGPTERPFSSPASAYPDEPGLMTAVYAVLGPVDPDVETVDVQVGFGGVVTDVPVGDGLLTPAVDADVVPLGTGWPRIDESAVAAVPRPEDSVHPLQAVTEEEDRSSVTTREPEQVSVDVAADVLFPVDSADLSPDAEETLRRVAEDVLADEPRGRLSIVGHTDSDASEAYNQDLSERRAASVADVLVPLLDAGGAAGDLDVVVEGRGETEPVADNATEQGRQDNRRVTVTYQPAGEAP